MSARRAVATAGVLVVGGLGCVPAAVGAASPDSRMLVTAVEYRLTLSRATVPAGTVGIQLVDKGMDPHDLAVRRYAHNGHLVGRTQRLAKLPAGGLESKTVTLTPGTWKLWCTLPGHDMKGMHVKLVVRRAGHHG